jgi:hypothetical protein
MPKAKYTKFQKEILEIYHEGKSAAEIAEIINAKYSTDITESSVNGAIKMNKGKQNENKQTKMFSENQERIQKKENPAQKGADKQENSEAKKMNESDRALLQAQVESFSRLEKELHNTFVVFTIINTEFSRAVDAIELKNRKNKSNYMLFGGIFLLFFIFSMLLGYHDANPDEDMSIFYLELLESIGIGMFISLVLGLIIGMLSKK